jgi:hypothetical protein
VPTHDCELALCGDREETRLPHTFLAEIQPGTYIRIQGSDWIVMEVHEREGDRPETICRPPSKRI